jgi:hypothetical protein
MIPLLLLGLLACGSADEAKDDTSGDTAADTSGDTDTDTDADTDTDTDSDTDTDTDTDSDSDTDTDTAVETQTGLLTWNGAATVDGDYVGTEQVLLLGDYGLGETACQVDYDVISTAPRSDCSECVWAYDVELGPPTVVVPDHCVEAGYDPETIAAIGGTTRSYGLALDFMGHGNALMMYADGHWAAVALVDWNEGTASMNYEWAQGYLDY